MKCEKIERWISDELDGALRPDDQERLGRHLAACPACRDFRRMARLIQAESLRIDAPTVSPEHLELLSARILAQLGPENRVQGEARRSFFRSWRWAWLAGPMAIVLVLGVLLFQGRRGGLPPDDVFSMEGCFDRVVREIGGDEELAASFENLLVEALAQEEEALFSPDDPTIWNEPDFWDALSEEALRLVEDEVKKEIRS